MHDPYCLCDRCLESMCLTRQHPDPRTDYSALIGLLVVLAVAALCWLFS